MVYRGLDCQLGKDYVFHVFEIDILNCPEKMISLRSFSYINETYNN